jgi:hypothetical protein
MQEVNDLLGFQLLINILSNIVITVLFGYYFFTTAYNGKLLFYASIQVSRMVDLHGVLSWAFIKRRSVEIFSKTHPFPIL